MILTNRKDLVENVKVKGNLDYSDHAIVEYMEYMILI